MKQKSQVYLTIITIDADGNKEIHASKMDKVKASRIAQKLCKESANSQTDLFIRIVNI